MVIGIVFQQELLIQAMHVLIVQKGGQALRSLFLRQQHALCDQLAHANQHAVAAVASLKADVVPADRFQLYCIHAGKKQHLLPQRVLKLRVNVSMTDQQRELITMLVFSGYSQTGAAKLLGVSQSTVSNWWNAICDIVAEYRFGKGDNR